MFVLLLFKDTDNGFLIIIIAKKKKSGKLMYSFTERYNKGR